MFDGFVRHGELWHPAGQVDEADPYRAIWNREADEDAVYSATGIVSHGREDYATLTATRQRTYAERLQPGKQNPERPLPNLKKLANYSAPLMPLKARLPRKPLCF